MGRVAALPLGLLAALHAAPAAVCAAAGAPGSPAADVDLVWTHTAVELEDLARAALPLRFDIGGRWSGQALVIQDVENLRAGPGRVRIHVKGRIEPLGVPLEADPALTLRFDPLKGTHVVALESLTLALGPLGKVDLSRLLGPWEIRPDQPFVVPVRGGAGLGVQVGIRRLDLSSAGLRVEVDVRYFPPPIQK